MDSDSTLNLLPEVLGYRRNPVALFMLSEKEQVLSEGAIGRVVIVEFDSIRSVLSKVLWDKVAAIVSFR